jgi:hypothetical protein
MIGDAIIKEGNAEYEATIALPIMEQLFGERMAQVGPASVRLALEADFNDAPDALRTMKRSACVTIAIDNDTGAISITEYESWAELD